MKLSVALFFAGLFGALAAVFILLSFGTDYWLLASESCQLKPNKSAGPLGVTIEVSFVLQKTLRYSFSSAEGQLCVHRFQIFVFYVDGTEERRAVLVF